MTHRRPVSQRSLFIGLMTGLATLFGSAVAAWEIFGQDDVIADVIQISAVILLGTAMLSTFFWTLTHLKTTKPAINPIRGLIAGLLTGLFIIPLPVFASKFKAEFISAYADESAHVVAAFFGALSPALITGLQTFQVLTKVSLAAAILSAVLGFAVAKWTRPDGRSRHQP
jgi:hypothetical protein